MGNVQIPAVPEEQWRELIAQLSDLLLLIEATLRVDQEGGRSRRLSTLKEVMSAAGITADSLAEIQDKEVDLGEGEERPAMLTYVPLSFPRRPVEDAAVWFGRYACDVIQRLSRHLYCCHPGLLDKLGDQGESKQ